MNTIKNNGIAFRKSILIPIALLAGILLSSFDLNDVEYGGRYVDLLNAKFHDTDFLLNFMFMITLFLTPIDTDIAHSCAFPKRVCK